MNTTRFKKGHVMSEEVRQKISNKLKGTKKSIETLKKMSIAQKKNKSNVSRETGEKISRAKMGKKASEETKRLMSSMRQKENHPNWKGGITPVLLQIRHCFKTRQWISDCFTRDNFVCQRCGKRGGKLCVHHIKYFSVIVSENNIKSLEDAINCDELWNLNNGMTLCIDCHKLIHKKNG